MYVQSSTMALLEEEIHHDAGAYPGPKAVQESPLVEELLLLWHGEDVRMWDESKQQDFNLRALLFVTIND